MAHITNILAAGTVGENYTPELVVQLATKMPLIRDMVLAELADMGYAICEPATDTAEPDPVPASTEPAG